MIDALDGPIAVGPWLPDRLIAKVRQPQPNSLPNQALPFDSLCGIIVSKINRYFTIVAHTATDSQDWR
jgi:hypothetical protein